MSGLGTNAEQGARDSLSVRFVRTLLGPVEAAGIARARLLRSARFDVELLEEVEGRVSRAEFQRLCDLALTLTGDQALGLHVGERMSAETFNIMGYLVAHSASLRCAFDALLRFHELMSDRDSLELTESADLVTVRLAPWHAPLHVRRFCTELTTTGLVRLINSFGAGARPIRVSFAYAAPSYRSEYTRIFQTRERFDEPFSGIVFDRKLMNAPSPLRDEDLYRALCLQAERRILRLIRGGSYRDRVTELLLQRTAQRADLSMVASALGLSPRSLRRRLAAEGTSYNAIANDALALTAKRLLSEQERTIQEVAYQMGFSHSSTFHRAFKRWTGSTPATFREHG